MLCNRDCLHCPFPDCIDNGVSEEEIATAAQRDIDAIGIDVVRRREAYRKAYRKMMADPERAAAYKAHLQANREKRLAYYRRHYAAHREERKAYQRAYNARKKAEREKELCR